MTFKYRQGSSSSPIYSLVKSECIQRRTSAEVTMKDKVRPNKTKNRPQDGKASRKYSPLQHAFGESWKPLTYRHEVVQAKGNAVSPSLVVVIKHNRHPNRVPSRCVHRNPARQPTSRRHARMHAQQQQRQRAGASTPNIRHS